MTKLLPVLAVALLASQAAFAEAGAAADEKKDRLICKRGQETGSRTRSPKTCFTASEWRALQNKKNGSNENANGETFMPEGVLSTPTSPQ